MKYLHFFLLALICLSCSKPDDSDPSTTTTVYLENKNKEDIKILFINTINTSEVIITKNQTFKLITDYAPNGGVNGILKNLPYSGYDSAKIYLKDSLIYEFIKNDCPQDKNLLCKDNYMVLKDETDKKGNRYIESKFIFNE